VQTKKHLSFGSLRKIISERAFQIEDPRREGSVNHEIHDCCLSGFAMMFFQDPSMLAFQKRIQDRGNKNNLHTIFGVGSIPKATQLRDVIDLIPSLSFDEELPSTLKFAPNAPHADNLNYRCDVSLCCLAANF